MIRLLRLHEERFEEAPTTLKHDLRWACWKRDGGMALLVGNAGTVVEYDGRRFVEYLTPTAENLRGVSWHPEGSYALVVGNHGTVFRFDGKKMTQIATGLQTNLRRVAFRPDGVSALVVGNNGAAFRFEKGKLSPLKAGEQNLRGIAWHQAGRFAVVAGDAGLYRYEDGAEQMTCLAEFPAGELLAADWKPDGTYALIVGSYNPWVSREDLDRICKYDGRELFLLLEPKPRKFLSGVAWRPDGAYALVLSIEGDIFRFEETRLIPWYADPAMHLVGAFWRPDGSSALVLGSPRAKYWTL